MMAPGQRRESGRRDRACLPGESLFIISVFSTMRCSQSLLPSNGTGHARFAGFMSMSSYAA